LGRLLDVKENPVNLFKNGDFIEPAMCLCFRRSLANRWLMFPQHGWPSIGKVMFCSIKVLHAGRRDIVLSSLCIDIAVIRLCTNAPLYKYFTCSHMTLTITYCVSALSELLLLLAPLSPMRTYLMRKFVVRGSTWQPLWKTPF